MTLPSKVFGMTPQANSSAWLPQAKSLAWLSKANSLACLPPSKLSGMTPQRKGMTPKAFFGTSLPSKLWDDSPSKDPGMTGSKTHTIFGANALNLCTHPSTAVHIPSLKVAYLTASWWTLGCDLSAAPCFGSPQSGAVLSLPSAWGSLPAVRSFCPGAFAHPLWAAGFLSDGDDHCSENPENSSMVPSLFTNHGNRWVCRCYRGFWA